MKKRERRRSLTDRYQAKQMRLRDTFWNRGGHFDPDRKTQNERTRKFHFICWLKGDYLESFLVGANVYYELGEKEKGRFRKHSWKGYGKCRFGCCRNPRKDFRGKRKTEYTRQERMSEMAFWEDVNEYGEEND